jgi:DNA-binding XRE family transcriptional regulator
MMARLAEALRELRLQAGEPSARTIAREAGISHTTVADTCAGKVLPRWAIVKAIVQGLAGDVDQFHELWVDAKREAQNLPPRGSTAGEGWSWCKRCECGSRISVSSSDRALVDGIAALWRERHACDMAKPEPRLRCTCDMAPDAGGAGSAEADPACPVHSKAERWNFCNMPDEAGGW